MYQSGTDLVADVASFFKIDYAWGVNRVNKSIACDWMTDEGNTGEADCSITGSRRNQYLMTGDGKRLISTNDRYLVDLADKKIYRFAAPAAVTAKIFLPRNLVDIIANSLAVMLNVL